MTRYTALLLAPVLGLWAATAQAAVIHVPKDEPTLRAAVATANSGDTIMVGAGRWCGADIQKRLTIVGRGNAVIVGGSACGAGPTVDDSYRVGLYLGSGADGTTIRHLTFDGSRADFDLYALAYGIYGDGVDDVRIEHVKVQGTVTAVVNRGGDDWRIRHVDIRGVSHRAGVGGRGIALLARGEDDRPVGTSVSHTDIQFGDLNPDGSSAGVYLAGTSETEVRFTRVGTRSRGNGRAIGVLVTSARFGSLPPPGSPPPPPSDGAGSPPPSDGAGSPPPPPSGGAGTPPPPPSSTFVEVASDGAQVTNNDGRKVSYVLVVHPGNATGLEHRANIGVTNVEGEVSESGGGRHAGRRGYDHDD